MTSSDDIFARAARGEIAAQVDMLDRLVTTALRPDALRIGDLGAIEICARLLAAHGHPEHRRRLAGVLFFRGSMCRLAGWRDMADPLIGEGKRYLRDLADAGDTQAAAQYAEFLRRLESNQSIPGEVMLGEQAPTSH